ncbi:MAG: Hypothetical protein BHV28_09660 [Candidatus Tokpelaia hoelldobleri]|uniref:SIMPL domain-containing protein n=1 Tax=Candidatus Tokpelaia hoelldobleri TaxID=1902579 RepID=A0A1U9JUY7_9HYPH|nr:MAG: Hypothetical protein BHV28_09660 [Candidatus Tokpelaia hoelldoblerii]
MHDTMILPARRFTVPLWLSAVIAGFMLLTVPVMAQPVPPAGNMPAHITVTATGTASAIPDMASLNLSVSRQATTAREALEQTNAAMAKVLEAARAAGIAADDMQTTGLNVQPYYVSGKYPNGERQQQGYEANNAVSIKVRDLNKLGAVVDKAMASGANGLDQITLTNANLQPLYDAAQKNAVANALAKAKLLAESAGVSIGRVLRINDASPMVKTMGRIAYASPSADAIASGRNDYISDISLTLELVAQKP